VKLDELRALFKGENAARMQSMLEELDGIDAQMVELTKKRTQLDADLNKLLANMPSSPRAPRQRSGGRRSGIRDNVLEAIKLTPGMSPAQIRQALGIPEGDKSGSQSVSNALSAMKKAGTIKETAPRQYAAA
jgi:hypothetical protein